MQKRSKKPTASRIVEINLNLKVPRKQLPLVEEALAAVLDLAGLKPEKADKSKTPPTPKATRATKAKPGPKPKVKPAAKAKSDKAKPGPKPKAKPGPKPKVKPAAKPKAKPGPKPKAKPAAKSKAKPVQARRTAAAPKASETAALIRDLRTKAGLSQKALAEKLNASQNAVSQLETGKLKPSVDMAIKLGQILGTPFQDLMK